MLKPDKSYFHQGITLNEFIITSHNEYCAATPQKLAMPRGIIVYSFPEVPIKSYIGLAEFYSRQVFYNRFKGFIPHYFIDKVSAWQLLNLDQQSIVADKIVIAICGGSDKAKLRTIDIICNILKQYDLAFNSVKLVNNSTQMFFDLLEEKVNKLGLPMFAPIEDEVKSEETVEIIDRAAHCEYEVYFNHQWQQPIQGKAIQAIRIRVSEGELFYRTHLINGGWLPWVKDGEMSGSEAAYIDGFQVKYISENNKLLYRFSIINSKPISWRSTNINVPTKKFLDNFEFKFE